MAICQHGKRRNTDRAQQLLLLLLFNVQSGGILLYRIAARLDNLGSDVNRHFDTKQSMHLRALGCL